MSRSSFDRIRTNTIVVEALRSPVPLWNSSNSALERRLQRLDADLARRHVAAERLAAFAQVFELGAVVRRTIERRVGDLLVRDRDAEARAEGPQVALVHLLLLVGDVLALTRFAEPVALDRPREDDRRLPLVRRPPP